MIHELFRAAAREFPDKIAIVGDKNRLSYQALHHEVSRLAQEMRCCGAQAGDRVAIHMPNGVEAAVTIWAALEAGYVLVPLHAGSRKDALAQVVSLAEPTLAVVSRELSARLPDLLAAGPGIRRVFIWESSDNLLACSEQMTSWRLDAKNQGASTQPSNCAPGTGALAALIFTSGSTGTPKGVMLSHANMLAALKSVNAYLQWRSDDIVYSALSIASSYGLYQLLLGLSIGATVVLDRSFAFPVHSLSVVANERATVFAGVPTMYAWMATSPAIDRHDLSRLRMLTSAGAALPVEHARKLRERFPAVRLFVMYGQTECKRISYLDPDDLERKPGSVGRGMPFQEHAVVDDNGNPVPAGKTGELVVRGPHVMLGYWRDPQTSAAKLRPIAGSALSWLHTGDLFQMDEEGYLYFVGRRDDLLMVGGNKVSPGEVEETLCEMPQVLEAAVIGMPDPVWGQAVKAYVIPKPGHVCTPDDVIRFCTPRMRGYMVPKAVTVTGSLPKTESGKIRKRDLK